MGNCTKILGVASFSHIFAISARCNDSNLFFEKAVSSPRAVKTAAHMIFVSIRFYGSIVGVANITKKRLSIKD